MTRDQLEHIIRASASIAGDDEIIVIGSQSILAQFPHAPAALLVSVEADVYPRNRPERWEVIDGAIGEGSPFHTTFGYYAQGVGEETAILPEGWKLRLVPVRGPGTRGATGLCLEVHDLVVSKLVAGREKDDRFVRAAIEHGLVERDTLVERIARTRMDARVRDAIDAKIAGWFERGELHRS